MLGRTLALSVLVVAVTALALLGGCLSNWYRYALSIEALLILGPMVLMVAMGVVPFALIGLRRRSTEAALISLAAMAVTTAAAAALSSRVLGSACPTCRLHDEYLSAFEPLDTALGSMRYALLLQDPFSSAHREYLLLQSGGSEHRIGIPLFRAASGGFGWSGRADMFLRVRPGRTSDLIVVEPTGYGRDLSGGEAWTLEVSLASFSAVSPKAPP